jgi:hypothetical protein
VKRRLARASVLALCGALVAGSSTGECATLPLAETARLLAGKGAAADSKLAEYAQTQFYAEYAEQMASGWKRFQQPNLERMRAWWASYAPARYSTVFYPFSGPDIANALALFPDADTYLMFGLEAPGAIPDLQAMPDDAIDAGLNGLRASLNTIFQVNFFLTRGMEKKLDRGSFNSITGLLLFFLATNGCEVTGARRIAVGANDPIPGVEVTFSRGGGKVQTLRYYRVNVADASVAGSSRDFLSYLKGQGRFVTLIKSASYLMHADSTRDAVHFDQIRSLILSQSDFLVQDDSGVPLRLFARDRWKLLFHGRYEAPIPEFARHLQKDLRVEMQRNSTGRLPFSYGYDYKPGESNLMTAELR